MPLFQSLVILDEPFPGLRSGLSGFGLSGRGAFRRSAFTDSGERVRRFPTFRHVLRWLQNELAAGKMNLAPLGAGGQLNSFIRQWRLRMSAWRLLTATLPLQDHRDVLARIAQRYLLCTAPFFLFIFAVNALGLARNWSSSPMAFLMIVIPLAGGVCDWRIVRQHTASAPSETRAAPSEHA